jgi:hypothetical protein
MCKLHGQSSCWPVRCTCRWLLCPSARTIRCRHWPTRSVTYVRISVSRSTSASILFPSLPRVSAIKAPQIARESGSGSGLFGAVTEVVTDLIGEFLPIARSAGARRTATKSAQRVTNKFATGEPVFAIQVLLRSESEIPGRAQAHLRSVIGAFDVFRGENYWRVRGPRVFGRHFGADTVLVRRSFDRRGARPRTGCRRPRDGVVAPPRR